MGYRALSVILLAMVTGAAAAGSVTIGTPDIPSPYPWSNG
jgi:hypothetical protein